MTGKTEKDTRSLLNEQIDYYRARADEYDEWHLRAGRYDRGPEHRQQWLEELEMVRTALDGMNPLGRVLELACGTGLWTGELAKGATTVTAVDAVPETIEINRAKTTNQCVEYQVVDIFDWKPREKYDLIFFGFWLSHVPPDFFESFWELVGSSLNPNGRVFFVDSLLTQLSAACDHPTLDHSGTVERKLNDGRQFRIVKRFYDLDNLEKRLEDLGWSGSIKKTGEFFFYGAMIRSEIR